MIRIKSIPNCIAAALLAVALTACADEPVDDAQTVEPFAAPAGDAAATDVAAPTAGQQAATRFVDPNDAAAEELQAVPNIDQALAEQIVAGRPYSDMLEVDQVLAGSLSEEEREAVYGRLWMPIDLNEASAEEILLIPGVGERMQHEFEEYRPYRGMAEFRREIGKYVDADEVARLEQYVELRD